MSNVIGMMVLVDSAALLKNRRIQEFLKQNSEAREIPVFTIREEDEFSSSIYMVADHRHVVNGQGTNNLTIKAAPGDELRWWETNISNNSPFEVIIKEVSPATNTNLKWQDIFHHTPSLNLSSYTGNQSIGLKGKDLFWTAAFTDHKYQTQIKEDTLLSELNINLDYHIDLQIMNKSHPEEKPVCIFRWFPKIQLQEAS
ncbi:AidA/PixA family protein [Marinilabilia salmonicolor]|uniref:AidA/PixA family protein n=1 Tax=Marinilabilia salmonicolor TaxID=989 RepID=UPI00029A657E|nr:AidA/PixA family protein [Marinilabilia salmonicolor]